MLVEAAGAADPVEVLVGEGRTRLHDLDTVEVGSPVGALAVVHRVDVERVLHRAVRVAQLGGEVALHHLLEVLLGALEAELHEDLADLGRVGRVGVEEEGLDPHRLAGLSGLDGGRDGGPPIQVHAADVDAFGRRRPAHRRPEPARRPQHEGPVSVCCRHRLPPGADRRVPAAGPQTRRRRASEVRHSNPEGTGRPQRGRPVRWTGPGALL